MTMTMMTQTKFLNMIDPSEIHKNLYCYRAIVRSVYDGDTLRVDVDMGLGLWNRGQDGKGVILRLYGCNAPELKGASSEAGKRSASFLKSMLAEGTQIIIKTFKDEKDVYGRYLANVFVEGQVDSVNVRLVKEGYAEEKYYDNKKEV